MIGDRINFTVNRVVGASNAAQWWVSSGDHTLLEFDDTTPGVYPHSYTVAGSHSDTNLTSVLRLQGTGDIAVTATCIPGASPVTNTDSQKLASLQAAITPIIAQNSGQATVGAIQGAIGDAFSGGGAPFRGGSGGFAVNFAAVPQSQEEQVANDAFGALAYAGGSMPRKAPPPTTVDRAWSLWADVRGSGFDNNGAVSSGRQVNLLAGLGYKLSPNLLVGVVGGYENFNYDVASLTGTLKGNGGTAGAYGGWRLAPTLLWDSVLTWSRVNYDASAGTAFGSFAANRWLASTGLTGTYALDKLILEPSARIFALWEQQDGYTDSLGTAQAQRNLSTGRVSAGGKVLYPWTVGAFTLTPYAGLYCDWRFGGNVVSSANAIVGIDNGWSARASGGLGIANARGGVVTLGGEYGGIGATYKLWTANARASWPF